MLLTPNADWGGEGSLGCGIGYGYLHRIPEIHIASQDPSDPEIGCVVSDFPDGGKEVESGLKATPANTAVGGIPEEGYADVRCM